MTSSVRRTRAILLAATAGLAISCSEPLMAPDAAACPCMSPQRQARMDAARKDLERASQRVQAEVLRTCDKWKHSHWECNNGEVRLDALECWILAGSKELDIRSKSTQRQRPRDLGILRRVNSCMNIRRWSRHRPGPDF